MTIERSNDTKELEIAKIKAETAKIVLETQKIKSQTFWRPILVIVGVIALAVLLVQL
jgi:hypothetical protein